MPTIFKPLKELSVFFPTYNEEANLENTITKALPVLKKIALKYEIIIVNDGSKDNTLPIAQALQKKYPKIIRIITHSPNRGYGAAFKSGLYGSKYEWIIFTDADGQFDFSEATKLIEKQRQTKADLVIGYYLKRAVPMLRIIGSKFWEWTVFFMFGMKVTDTDCGFKLISKKVADTVKNIEAERGPFANSEFLIKSKKSGFKIVEIGVHHYPRTAGVATGVKLNVILAGFKDLIRLWYKINFSRA